MFTELTRELLDLTATRAGRARRTLRCRHRLLLLQQLRLPLRLPLMFDELTTQLLDLRAVTLGKPGGLFAMVLDCCSCSCTCCCGANP